MGLGGVVSPGHLHLIALDEDVASTRAAPPCRRPGCESAALDKLGFCAACRASYNFESARRRRFVDAVVDRLVTAGDPLFAIFGSLRPRRFGAHVLAHLEDLDARDLHVPASAVNDYLAELDEAARETA